MSPRKCHVCDARDPDRRARDLHTDGEPAKPKPRVGADEAQARDAYGDFEERVLGTAGRWCGRLPGRDAPATVAAAAG